MAGLNEKQRDGGTTRKGAETKTREKKEGNNGRERTTRRLKI